MRASGTFKVVAFTPVEPTSGPAPAEDRPAGVATMEKRYEGEVEGRSATRFPTAPDRCGPAEAETYAAVESFEGSLGGASGTFEFAYSATAEPADGADESFRIVPASGTGRLAGISGSGGMSIEPDGTHRIWFEYELD